MTSTPEPRPYAMGGRVNAHPTRTVIGDGGCLVPPRPSTTCLVAVWDDGVYRVRCGMGTAGVCGKHGKHEPHPSDGRPCEPNPNDGYCHTHGVYMPPTKKGSQ